MVTRHPPAQRLSVHLRNFAPADDSLAHVLRTAEAADAAGIHRVLVSDHVLFGDDLDAYGRSELGGHSGRTQPTGPDGQWLDPIVVLSLVAARTRHVRLGTAVLLAALRTPAVLAKQLSTLDVLSGGRVDLGVGVGWQREEYDGCGLDFDQRGQLLDRNLEIITELWRHDPVTASWGAHRFRSVHQRPRPVQDGGIPIWISGRINRRVVRRVVDVGSGWIPWGEHEADPGPGIEALRRALADAGRDPDGLRVLARLPVTTRSARGELDAGALVGATERLARSGVTDFHLAHAWGTDASRDHDLMSSIVATLAARFGA